MKYHPHGDAANFEIISNEGQYWNNNVMTIVPQGNFGSIRGDRPASGRYTEAKMSEYLIDCFFDDFEKYCVPMKESYDGERMEPEFLPAKYPHALFNPQLSGIGYGLASNIISFNVTEVLRATIKLIKDPSTKIMLIPDIPTGADIVDNGTFKEINKTGVGKITMRASAKIDHNKNIITITSLPLQTSSMQVIDKIIEKKKKNEFQEIIDILDYTKLGITDIRFILKNDANPDKVLKKLYNRGTGLKSTFPVCLKLIDDYREFDYGVKSFLKEWIEYRRDVVRAMFSNDLIQTMEKQHMNDVLLFVFNEDNAEKTLKICKNSNSRKDTIEKLMKVYKITSLQASTIADMRLYHFNKDTYARYKEDKKVLAENVERIMSTLDNEKLIDQFIIEQLESGIKKYGHPRHSQIVKDDSEVDIEQIPNTNHLIAITESGIIKKIDVDKYHTVGNIGTKNGTDNFSVISINNREDILVIDSSGLGIRIPVSSLPDMTMEEPGVEISRYFKFSGKIITVMKLSDIKVLKDKKIVITLVTKYGYAKRVKLTEFKGISEPRNSITLNDGDEVVSAMFSLEDDKNDIIIYTDTGYGVRLPIDSIKIYGKAAKGIRHIMLHDGENVINANIIDPQRKTLLYVTTAGRMKVTQEKYFPRMSRTDEPLQLITLDKNEKLFYISSVRHKKDKVRVFFKNQTPVDFELNNLEMSTRKSKGEKVLKVPRGEMVVSLKIMSNS